MLYLFGSTAYYQPHGVSWALYFAYHIFSASRRFWSSYFAWDSDTVWFVEGLSGGLHFGWDYHIYSAPRRFLELFFLLGIQIQSDSGRYCLELFILLGISTLSVSRRCLEVSNLLRILKGFPLNHIHYRWSQCTAQCILSENFQSGLLGEFNVLQALSGINALGHILIRGFGPYSLIVGRKISWKLEIIGSVMLKREGRGLLSRFSRNKN